ncbi:MAG: hypothetical protein ABI665_06520 [Vicinamibacterales bacterium]
MTHRRPDDAVRASSGYGGQALALTAALSLAAFGLVRGTWAVGGSDSSCYALMAEAFAHGHLQPTSAMAIAAPWPDAPLTLAPAGFVPSPVRRDGASPICGAGMSVLMAPLMVVGGARALFLITPVAAALLVWFSFVLAQRLAGGMAGAVAAVLVAASPIVLFQAVQPMNDIVTAALWMAALAAASWESRHSGWLAGALTGVAILVRPNLAPIAALVAATRFQVPFFLGLVPGVAILLGLNFGLYGSPFRTGYGDAGRLFALSHVPINAANYWRALLATQSIFPLVALVAPFVLARAVRRLAWLWFTAAVIVVGIYLFYLTYPEWWYLRFLMPALVLSTVLASAAMVDLARRARMGGGLAIFTVVLAFWMLKTPAAKDALSLQRLEGRFRETGGLVRDRLPAQAVLITVWQSGSMKFHAGREAVMWDSLDPAWLDRSVEWLTAQGRPPYILLERREEAEFRERFRGASVLGALDWPPRFDLNRQVRIFDPADRARYLAGEPYPTENVRGPRQ